MRGYRIRLSWDWRVWERQLLRFRRFVAFGFWRNIAAEIVFLDQLMK
jgi:hypothetical protein